MERMSAPIDKSMLILASSPASLIPAENFLMNRDWVVHVATDMKAALTYLVEKKPRFVMVSVEHPDKKIAGLPRLLKQTYPDLCVIAFAETTSLEGYRLLSQSEGPYRVHPPITGPAIERAVNKFMKELQDRQQQENALMQSQRRAQAKIEADLSRVRWQMKSSGDKNLLSKVTGRTLEQICERGDGQVRKPINAPTTNVACIVIESAQFSGYLLAAMGGDGPLDPRFVSTVRERLVKFLRDNGEEVKDRGAFPMKLREVPFESWAIDYAEFLKKAVHRGHEVAFAFFPVEEVSSMVLSSQSEEMGMVKVEDIDTAQPVPFDIHLFLPANQKYILYTPKNALFYPHQKERLVNAGVAHLHIKKADADSFLRYRAERNLNGLLDRFSKDRPPEAA